METEYSFSVEVREEGDPDATPLTELHSARTPFPVAQIGDVVVVMTNMGLIETPLTATRYRVVRREYWYGHGLRERIGLEIVEAGVILFVVPEVGDER